MLYEDLLNLKKEGRAIRIAMSGAGWMGIGFATQVKYIPGMRVVVVVDQDTSKARQALASSGALPCDIIETDKRGVAEDEIKKGKCVITSDYTLAAELEQVDVITDVTRSPLRGAEMALAGIQGGKDVVLVNVEADVTVGRALKKIASERGVIYSVSSGDEPGCLMELWDFVNSLGYEPIVIGKGKNNPLQPEANPDTVSEAAKLSGKEPYQVASYIDGTKTMFEMACVANATGCLPMKRGMIGPRADLSTVSEVFALEEDGGITTEPGSVDFVQGPSMAGGVFITVRVKDKRLCEDLDYLKVGRGPYYTFFRPYHLWFLEAPLSLAKAKLWGKPTLVPLDEPVTEVIAIAKKTLEPGEVLDDFGGYTFYGLIERAEDAKKLGALPAGLCPGLRVARAIGKGEVIKWEDVELDESSTIVRLRRMQEKMG